MPCRRGRARPPLTRHATGLAAEILAAERLEADGWTILARRLRTGAGELDLVAERNGMLAFIEVKRRPTLASAAAALSVRQQSRLLGAAEAALAAHPEWNHASIRFDVVLVDGAGRVRRIQDALRQG